MISTRHGRHTRRVVASGRFDPIAFVQATYAIGTEPRVWLAEMAAWAARDFSSIGRTTLTTVESPNDSIVVVHPSRAPVSATRLRALLRLRERSQPRPTPIGDAASLSDLVADGSLTTSAFALMAPMGQDAFWIRAEFENASVHLLVALPGVRRTPNRQRQLWNRLALHVATCIALRTKAQILGTSTPELRASIRRIVAHEARREKPSLTMDESQCVSAWEAVCSGTWSLVDAFDHQGQRFLVAKTNRDTPDPRQLSPQERQVAEFLAQGLSNKLIGYELGLSTSRAGTLVGRVQQKLGAATRAEAIQRIHALHRVRGRALSHAMSGSDDAQAKRTA